MKDDHAKERRFKEIFWGLVGSVQTPVDDPVLTPQQYSALVKTADGPKIARLTLTFEHPQNKEAQNEKSDTIRMP